MAKRSSWIWLAGLTIPIVLAMLAGSAMRAQQDKAALVEIWPVEIREVATIEAGSLAGNTVILLGRVIDSETREEIGLGQVAVRDGVAILGVVDAPFAFAVPAMSVVTLTVTAPGYQARQVVMKAHYRRDVTLMVDIPLEALGAEEVD